MKQSASSTVILCTLLAGCGFPGEKPGDPFDILISGGEVVDGSGERRFRADVGIRGDRIEFIGQSPEGVQAAEVIDASGLVVAPGFIDVHSHVFDIVDDDGWRGPQINPQYLTQGVTTIVTGADGFWSPSQIRAIKNNLGEQGSGVNYACYVGHNGIRRAVMGENQRRAPTDAELGEMRAQIRAGMEEGCVGLSTGLMYEPGMFSDTDEVIALAREVKPFNGTYDSHVRDPGNNLIESDKELLEIARAAGISAKIAHEKAVGLQNKGNIGVIIDLVETAREEGLDVVTDQYPYDSAATHTLYELILFPGIQDLNQQVRQKQLGLEELHQIIRDAIRDPSRRDRLKEHSENGLDGGFSWIKMTGYGSIRILVSEEDESLAGQNVQLLADRRGMDPFDLVVELILGFDAPLLATFGAIDENDVQTLMVKSWNMIASDGFYVGLKSGRRGHPRSTGTFTRVLGHYARELGLLELEEAVRKMTSLPADHLGFAARGRLQVGRIADVVVFDPETVIDRSTWSNPDAFSEGIEHVLVNGKFALRKCDVTGVAAGIFVSKSR